MTMLKEQESKETSFLRSALTIDNPFITTDEFLDWFKSKNQPKREGAFTMNRTSIW